MILGDNGRVVVLLRARARVDHGVGVELTGNHRNMAAGSGFHDADCSPVFSSKRASPSASQNLAKSRRGEGRPSRYIAGWHLNPREDDRISERGMNAVNAGDGLEWSG